MKRVLVVMLFSAFTTSAFAQNKPTSSPSKKQAPTQRIDITDGETAIGERQGPDSGRVTVKPPVKFGKLIKVREDFNVEIVKSAHEL